MEPHPFTTDATLWNGIPFTDCDTLHWLPPLQVEALTADDAPSSVAGSQPAIVVDKVVA